MASASKAGSREAEHRSLRCGLREVIDAGPPPHRYVLAADELDFYDGPKWVPVNLWNRYTFEPGGDRVRECARKLIYGAKARDIWAAIAKRCDRPNHAASHLPVACAQAIDAWNKRPRMTPEKWVASRKSLAHNAAQLAVELDRFSAFCGDSPDEWDGLLSFVQLLTDDEKRRLELATWSTAFNIHNRARERAGLPPLRPSEYAGGTDPHHEPGKTDAATIYGLFDDREICGDHGRVIPTLPVMLRRIARALDVEAASPPVPRPRVGNAERNYFARALIHYFRAASGVSPTIIADIVAVFYEEPMGPNYVSQLIRSTPTRDRYGTASVDGREFYRPK